MRVMVAGAYGFIGSGIVSSLLSAGHEVIGAGRDVALGRRFFPDIEWIYTDFNHDLDASLWQGRFESLGGRVDAVVNAVGILQSDLRDESFKVHGAGARALFEGAERAGVKKLIQISATTLTTDKSGVTHNVETDYAASKMMGEDYLKETNLNWTIIRPSLVVGPGSNGGVLLLRGLAGLPFIIGLPAAGEQGDPKFQPLTLDDLSLAVLKLVEDGADEWAGETIYAVGREVLGLSEIVLKFRRWLGFGPARFVYVPRWVLAPLLMVGDLMSYFGNRSSFRSASLKQMDYFTRHDVDEFQRLLGAPPQSLSAYLSARPADLADRQQARCVFLVPLLKWVMGLSFILLGVLGLMSLIDGGFQPRLSDPGGLLQSGEAFLSIIAGGLFLSNRWMRIGGILKISLLLIMGLYGLSFVTDMLGFFTGVLGILLPVLTIAVVMGMIEPR